VIDDLRSGRSLERVLTPMLDELERERVALNSALDDLKPGQPRDTTRGRITGIEYARYRIMRDNVVTVG
jgi:hypothetical protein